MHRQRSTAWKGGGLQLYPTRQARTHNTTAAAARYRDVDMMNLYVKLSSWSYRLDHLTNSGSTCTNFTCLSAALRCIAHLAECNPQTVGFYDLLYCRHWLTFLLTSLALPLPPPSSLIFFWRGERRGFYVLCTMSAKFAMGISLECGRLHLSLGPPCAG